jgi:hypothetical protein
MINEYGAVMGRELAGKPKYSEENLPERFLAVVDFTYIANPRTGAYLCLHLRTLNSVNIPISPSALFLERSVDCFKKVTLR